jgi:steroid 5-alpha reductase family enzyme
MAAGVTSTIQPFPATLVMGLVIFSILWLIHVRREDASLVDYWWATGFAAIALVEFAWAPDPGGVQLFVTLAVALWAARLTIHLVGRHLAKGGAEDWRYADMRKTGGPNWWIRNLFTVFWLQAVFQWLLAAPIHAVMLAPDPAMAASLVGRVLIVVGALVFFAGFFLEWVADRQLAAFVADPDNKGELLTTGVWAWSRHPNYFGEATVWWGLGLVAVGASGLWYVLAAPAALTFLLLKVSGVPLLEASMADRPGWPDYVARTSRFIPRPPRRPAAKREGAIAAPLADDTTGR